MLSKSLQTILGVGDKEAQRISAALDYIFGEDSAGIDEYILKNSDVAERLKRFLEERRYALLSKDTKPIKQYAQEDVANFQAVFKQI